MTPSCSAKVLIVLSLFLGKAVVTIEVCQKCEKQKQSIGTGLNLMKVCSQVHWTTIFEKYLGQ